MLEKKIGENIEIINMIIHQVKKDSQSTDCEINYGKTTLEITTQEQGFMQKINESHYKRHSPIYGVFDKQLPRDFSDMLNDYLTEFKKKASKLDDFFLQITKEMVEHYRNIIKPVNLATGGHLIFCHFNNLDRKEEYFVVIAANNKNSFMIDEKSLTIKPIQNLDLNKLDVACQINITEMDNAAVDDDNAKYLSFIKGAKDISSYFMDFINCEDKSKPKDLLKHFMQVFDNYCAQENITNDKLILRDKIIDYATRQIKQNQPIKLSAISGIINPEDPGKFQEYASHPDRKVSAELHFDVAHLNKYRYIKLSNKNNNIRLQACKSYLGKKIVWDKKAKTVTIKDVDETWFRDLEKSKKE